VVAAAGTFLENSLFLDALTERCEPHAPRVRRAEARSDAPSLISSGRSKPPNIDDSEMSWRFVRNMSLCRDKALGMALLAVT
jgi:hypothetical protein